MTAERSFNRRIERFLSEQSQSSASQTIRRIEKLNPNFNSYYGLFDDFSDNLGRGFIAQAIVNKNYKTIGYIPLLKYYPNNLLNEEPRVEKLISEGSLLTLNSCYDYLAKELLYRLMRVPDLESIITKNE